MKKTRVRTKDSVRICGYCQECNKELLSNQGGWIISYNNKKYYCHDGKDGSCYDNYCQRKLKEKQYANGRKKEVQLYESWKEKSKSIRQEKGYENEIKRSILMLTSKQKTLPPALKKKILASKMKKKKKNGKKK